LCLKYDDYVGDDEVEVLKVGESSLAFGSVVEISSEEDYFCSIHVSKYRMNKEIGFRTKLLQILEDFDLQYRHLPSGIDSLTLVLYGNQLHQKLEGKLLQRINTELSPDEVTTKRKLALITVVEGKTPYTGDGIARATKVLAEKSIHVEMIHMNQASSQINLVFGVNAHDKNRAVAALYDEFSADVPV